MKKRWIDYDKCIGCKQCVSDCVNGYITDVNADGEISQIPFLKERGVCLDCGHCEAICPVGAIENVSGQVGDIDGSVLRLMTTKRTVRRYEKDSVIDKALLDRIVLAGQSAPTDRNRKTCRMILVKEKLPELYREAVAWLWGNVEREGSINPLYTSTKRMMENIDEILWNAEYLVCFVGNRQYIIDAAISAERMQLEAESIGVSTAYRGDMKNALNGSERCRDILGLRSNEEVLVTFAMGYSPVKYCRASVKRNRKVEFL